MHFIGFASIDVSYANMQFRIFDPKRTIIEDLASHIQNLVEHRLFHFNSLFN